MESADHDPANSEEKHNQGLDCRFVGDGLARNHGIVQKPGTTTVSREYTPRIIVCARRLFAGVSADRYRLYSVNPTTAHKPIAANRSQNTASPARLQ